MKYTAAYKFRSGGISAQDAELRIEKEGIYFGNTFVDYADFDLLQPINHRVIITLQDGEEIEISMLGFSYDGFWEELAVCYNERSMQALFVAEDTVMNCEGEYSYQSEAGPRNVSGRGRVILVSDAVIILPPSSDAVRIPLFYVDEIISSGYMTDIRMKSGKSFRIGKFGYDTKPFMERCEACMRKTKADREKLLKSFKPEEPFMHIGLFRTIQKTEYWGAAFGNGTAAVELYTNEDSAIYLYRYDDRDRFCRSLEESMEAVGNYREIIFLSEDELNKKPLYRMSVHRSSAVRFLRSCSAGRLIHRGDYEGRLEEFLRS